MKLIIKLGRRNIQKIRDKGSSESIVRGRQTQEIRVPHHVEEAVAVVAVVVAAVEASMRSFYF